MGPLLLRLVFYFWLLNLTFEVKLSSWPIFGYFSHFRICLFTLFACSKDRKIIVDFYFWTNEQWQFYPLRRWNHKRKQSTSWARIRKKAVANHFLTSGFLFKKILYPTGVPHSEKNCTPRVPHLKPFVPHSIPEQLATLFPIRFTWKQKPFFVWRLISQERIIVLTENYLTFWVDGKSNLSL